VYASNANVLSGVTASVNGNGILINHAASNQISSPFADSNSGFGEGYGNGIWLENAANANTIAGGHANSNSSNGIRIEQSSANQVSGIELNNSGMTGIYLGCDGPTTGTCTTGFAGVPMSNANGIDANINITSTGNPGWGIVIDKGNLSNTIVGNTSSANATLDEYDGNKCGVNNWFADNFGTSNASCVH